MNKETDTEDSLDLSKTPQLSSNLLGMLSHSSGLHTQFVPCTKKYLLFQFLLESGMFDTNLNDGFLAKKL